MMNEVDHKPERWYDQVMFYLFWIYADQVKLMWWQMQDAWSSKTHYDE